MLQLKSATEIGWWLVHWISEKYNETLEYVDFFPFFFSCNFPCNLTRCWLRDFDMIINIKHQFCITSESVPLPKSNCGCSYGFHYSIPLFCVVSLFHAPCGLIPSIAASCPGGEWQACPCLAYFPFTWCGELIYLLLCFMSWHFHYNHTP
jgi:hypothetical protein